MIIIKGEESRFYTKDKETPGNGMISDSVANGRTGDLRLEIRPRMADSSGKGRGHNLPQETTINPIQSTGHPVASMQRAVPVSEVAGNSKGRLAELVEGNCELRTGPMPCSCLGAPHLMESFSWNRTLQASCLTLLKEPRVSGYVTFPSSPSHQVGRTQCGGKTRALRTHRSGFKPDSCLTAACALCQVFISEPPPPHL